MIIIFAESSRPESSYFNTDTKDQAILQYGIDQQQFKGLGHAKLNSINDNRALELQKSLSSSNSLTGDDEYNDGYSINPDTFTFAEVSHSGNSIGMPELGVHMVIPEGALDKGYTEEIFLAVMTEDRDRPRLSDNQTLLSPVILAGPPRVSFRKPVVISFGHCADLSQTSNRPTYSSKWELALYHCDSLFSDHEDTPWVKLANLTTLTNKAKQGITSVSVFKVYQLLADKTQYRFWKILSFVY